jgi:phosphoribosylamine--glycine ligase
VRVFVIGQSTVEHALLWRLAASRRIAGLYCAAPAAAGLGLAKLIGARTLDAADIREACREQGINLAILRAGRPETQHLARELRGAGIAVIAPDESLLRLTEDPTAVQAFVLRHGIPAQAHATAAGRAERLRTSPSTALDEVSFAVLSDGRDYKVFPPCQRHDYCNGDGRPPEPAGALAPAPWVNSSLLQQIHSEVVERTMEALDQEGLSHRGILECTVTVTSDGPLLAGMRPCFAEPEALVLLPLLDADFGAVLEAIVDQKLSAVPFALRNGSAVAIVLKNLSRNAARLSTASLAVAGYRAQDEAVFLAQRNGHARMPAVPPSGTATAVGLGRDTLRARDRALRLARELAEAGLSFHDEVGSNLFQ